MRFGRLCVIVLLATAAAWGQKKQIQELQRDMALLQDEVRTMNERLTNLTVMVEQLLDRVSSTNTAVTVLESSLEDSLKKHQQAVAAPVAALGAKVDQMANEFRYVRESIADLNSRIGKMQAQLDDLKTTVQILAAPPAPPGAETGSAPAAGSAEELFNNARRDQSGGKLDLALMEFQEFLELYPNSDLAPAAQYSIGEIYFAKGDFEAAAKAFDLVLERYPENDKTPDAAFMKAKSLAEAGQKRRAAVEFRGIVKKYADLPIAERARQELARLGY